ncbi:helix-turn-helix transcriptional regulator [Streptomyces sp. HD]|uniref:helix-turn-helix transcriptional regulator n=1 Tax=Streptomyces sp. HD TaxID=3020892 RepID=UPI002330F613|nr:YafY family protein [Streptomyces sp. HD]MDC0766502.1 YafY family protein [Streptomyces sp. HD]
MKSSRLVSILLLLQTRGRLTAAQLAAELEVSVRTIYRDVEALGTAGIPLYGDAGHAGGYRLLDGYRTRLTGLTTDEAEALFLAGVPGPAAELGLGSVLAAAQLKVRAALPAELRTHADRISGRFHLDAPGWYADSDETPHLPAVADAVWNGRVLRVLYRRWREPTDVERRLEPYGLVLKAGRWYVVAGPGPRTYRVDQILRLAVTDEEFTRPDDFDLAGYWAAYQRDFHDRLRPAEALVRLAPGVRLAGPMGAAVRADGRKDDDGWTLATVPIESVDHAHGEFLRLGTDIEVLRPAALRERIAATVRELANRYRGTAPGRTTESGTAPTPSVGACPSMETTTSPSSAASACENHSSTPSPAGRQSPRE